MFTRRRLLEVGAVSGVPLLLGRFKPGRPVHQRSVTLAVPPARGSTLPVNVKIGPPPGNLLRWTPPGYPSYAGYTTVNIANDGSNRSQTLSQTSDYILVIDDYNPTVANLGGITISGGRNIVIIGGRINIANIDPAPTQSTQTAIKIRGGVQTIHIEGLEIGGRNCNDCIALQDPKNGQVSTSVIQIQNCRINPQLPEGTTIASGMHPDGIQFQQEADGYPGTVRLDKVTFTSVYQCLFIKGPTTGGVVLSRVNCHPVQDVAAGKTAHYLFWQETASIPVSIPDNDVYVEENLAESNFTFANELYPDGSSPRTTEAPTITTDGTGTYATWAGGVGITGRIYKGNPAGGDYCAAGVPGVGYVSPGYL